MCDNSLLDLIKNSISSLQPVIDVNNVIGAPITMDNGNKVFPLVKISVGYVAGGGEYSNKNNIKCNKLPFVGGSSSGCSAEPIGFLIVKENGSELITISNTNAFADIAQKVTDTLSYALKKLSKAKLEKAKKGNEKHENN